MRGHGELVPPHGDPPSSLAARAFRMAQAQARGGEAPLQLREQSGGRRLSEVLSRSDVLRAAHFDPAWGAPPTRPGLLWNRERFVLEPVAPSDPGPGGALGREYARFLNLARQGLFRQWHRADHSAGAAWGQRWVRVFTPIPDPSTPYELVAESALPI